MPGSPQATPGEAESSGPQEVLKPPHTLEIQAGQQRRRRERVSRVGRREDGCSSARGHRRCHGACLFPTEGPGLSSRQ